MTAMLPQLSNVQANILRGSSTWRTARYVFYRIRNASRAATFIDALRTSPHLKNADNQKGADANINIAFTHRGLEMLNATLDDTARFQGRGHTLRAFKESEDEPEPEPRSAFEGGMFAADMDHWPMPSDDGYIWPEYESEATAWWSQRRDKKWKPTPEWPHILVWISAINETVCSAVYDEVERLAGESVGDVYKIGHQDAAALPGYEEHFGFVDGISQPAIEGIRQGKPGDGKLGARGWEGIKVGEFILGYPDESRQPVGRPLPNELARDGTFLVYRKLRQDVQAFREATAAMSSTADPLDPVIAEGIMGRKRDGNPHLVPPGAPTEPQDGLENDFTYAQDRRGLICPLGSHVRRANPRDDLHFEGRRVNGHRIIRRGMPYGKPYTPDIEDDDGDRGLIFIAFNARIEDQFEFIQKNWLNRGTTFRLGDDADPIAGVGTDIRIVINGDKPVYHKADLPFTQFLGGDYFFVPSIKALEQIAARGRAASSGTTPSR